MPESAGMRSREGGAQLALGIRLRDDATLDNFHVFRAQAQVISVLREQLDTAAETCLYLWGPPGSGRSHLLQAACHQRAAGGALYLPLAQLREHPAEQVLADMEQLDLLCLDDVDAVAGDPAWEQALFHLYNRARESGARLLLSAARPPRKLPLSLADLQSRLSGGVVLQLPAPEDDEKLEILRFRAARRGLELSAEVAAYIMGRSPRSLAELMSVLEQLDDQSLVQQRLLSIPFVKQTMGW